MKQKMTRLLRLALALCLLLGLCACGGGQPPAATGSAGTEDAAAAPGSVPAEPGTSAAGEEPLPARTEAPASGSDSEDSLYNGLFDSSRVHTVEVSISDEDWADLRANPLDKTKYKATVVIDGEKLEQVSFATKGNTSLSSVASDPDSDRYSFKLNFGKYDKSQSYHGLNKLSLNNLYADATCLKDYLSYGLFRRIGVEAPLASFVWLKVNGADHGLYIALEDVSESWLARTNEGRGVIYKPEAEELDQAGGDMGQRPGFPGGQEGGFPGGFPGEDGQAPAPPDGQAPVMPSGDGQAPAMPDGTGQAGMPPSGSGQMDAPPTGEGQAPAMPNGDGQQPTPPDGQQPTPPEGEGGQQPGFPGGNGEGFPGGNGEGFPGGGAFPGGGGFGGSAKGSDLRYTDEDPDSYSDIFDNAETDADEAAQARVIAALKALSEGRPEEALDTEQVIRYFAAHNFVLNYDSYTGNMLHNYYLYEKDGKLSMLPWDYNLAFGGFGGGMGGGDATLLINTGIDTPLSGAQEADRPMWAWIPADEACLEQYHQALAELLDYFESGDFEAELDSLCAMLRPYVEKDPTAFYTAEQFDKAVQTLRQFCLLRAASVRAQLEGSLAASTREQDAAARIDGSGLSVSDMGGFGGGRGGRAQGRP